MSMSRADNALIALGSGPALRGLSLAAALVTNRRAYRRDLDDRTLGAFIGAANGVVNPLPSTPIDAYMPATQARSAQPAFTSINTYSPPRR
jgi:hypothetical protein